MFANPFPTRVVGGGSWAGPAWFWVGGTSVVGGWVGGLEISCVNKIYVLLLHDNQCCVKQIAFSCGRFGFAFVFSVSRFFVSQTNHKVGHRPFKARQIWGSEN